MHLCKNASKGHGYKSLHHWSLSQRNNHDLFMYSGLCLCGTRTPESTMMNRTCAVRSART